MENGQDVVGGEKVIELHLLVLEQLPGLCPVGKQAVAGSVGLGEIESEQSPRKVRREIAFSRAKQPLEG